MGGAGYLLGVLLSVGFILWVLFKISAYRGGLAGGGERAEPGNGPPDAPPPATLDAADRSGVESERRIAAAKGDRELSESGDPATAARRTSAQDK